MKLYTEEQIREALWKTEHPFSDGKTVDEIMKSLTPIELPSEREIEDNAKHYGSLIGNKNGTAVFDYFKGAKFVIDKIQGGNNEQQ